MDISWYNLVLIILVGVTVYSTRILGLFIMQYIELTPRRSAILSTMAYAILLAIVINQAIKNELDVKIAIIFAAATFLLSNNKYLSIILGMAVAAIYPHILNFLF